jgi:hypothetical protein
MTAVRSNGYMSNFLIAEGWMTRLYLPSLYRRIGHKKLADPPRCGPMLAAAVNSTVVADEDLTVGSPVSLPAESIAPGR